MIAGKNQATNPEDLPAPVFVLAPPGIPVETVAAMIGQHPQCWGVPEIGLELSPNLDALMRDMVGVRSGQLHGLMRCLSQLLIGEQTIIGIDAARRWLSARAYLPTNMVWHLLAGGIAPRRMVAPVVSTLFESGSLARLAKVFPQARYVALTMHPKSHGSLVMSQNGGAAAWLLGAVDETVQPVMPEPSQIWSMADDGIRELSSIVPAGQMMSLRIEDLVHDTHDSLNGLCEWLDLEPGEGAIAAMQHPELSPFRGLGPFGANRSINIQTLAELRSCVPTLDSIKLDGHAPWRPDGMPLAAPLRNRATEIGYR